jgi:hypothetical protein
MTAEVIEIHERNRQIEAALEQFRAMKIGERAIYHTGLQPEGIICRAALRADELGIGLLFRRPTGRKIADLREFDFILIRCSRETHAALRFRT